MQTSPRPTSVPARYYYLPLALLMCVTAAHLVALHWAGRPTTEALQTMTDPVFARVLVPLAPPAAPKPTRAKPSTPAAKPASDLPTKPNSATTSEPNPSDMPSAAEPTPEPAPAAEAAPPSDTTTPASVPIDPWPPNTRVNYRIKGYFRGDFYGSAKVQWQRQAERYQVQLDLRMALVVRLTLTSQGQITSTGLAPDIYEELRPGRRDLLTIHDQEIRLNDGQTTPKPDGVQDTASQFVELSHRFATGRDVLKVGGEVSLWLARPNGVDLWTYDVVAEDTLQTPELGPVQAFHLKPRPLARPRGPIMADLWFAPSLQYLPVRILITQGDSTFVDLMVEKIEQTETPTGEAAKSP